MKIQLDTVSKTIKLESSEKMSKIIETLKKLFPNGEWKEFTLETNTVINNWNSPIVIREYRQPAPYYPWYNGTSYTSQGIGIDNYKVTANNSVQLNAGTYNVEA